MTLRGDGHTRMHQAMGLLANARAGKHMPHGIWVPPKIIGAPGCHWNEETALD